MTRVTTCCAVLVVGLIFAVLQGQVTFADAIAPQSMVVHFSRGEAKQQLSRTFSAAGRTYTLSLEPQYGIGRYTVGVSLVLQEGKEPHGQSNLLSPPGNWHGLQPYDFMAWDLRQGVAKSTFGARRSISVPSAGLTMHIDVQKAVVSIGPHRAPPMPADYPQLDDLQLAIRIKSLR
jgi:hypothetical protein